MTVIFPFGDPDAQHAHLVTTQQENLETQVKFLQSLDLFQLEQLHTMLSVIIARTKASEPANWYLGIVYHEAFVTRKVCIMCRDGGWVIHADPMESVEAHAKIAKHMHQHEKLAEQDSFPYQQPDHERLDEGDDMETQRQGLIRKTADANFMASAEEYGVTVTLTEDGIDYAGKVTCIECGTEWPNLDDRMLRRPKADGCGGCQQKAKWG